MCPRAFIIIFLLSLVSTNTQAESILFYFIDEGAPEIQNDRYFLEQKQQYDRLIEKTKFKFDYQFATIPRIDADLAANRLNICATAFIKTPARMNAGIQYVLRHKKDIAFHIYKSADQKIKLDSPEELKAYRKYDIHAFGVGAEEELKRQKIDYTAGEYMDLSIKMLVNHRILFLIAPEHTIDFTAAVRSGQIVNALNFVRFPGYIVCSRRTPKELLVAMVHAAKTTGNFVMKDSYKASMATSKGTKP